MLVEEVSNEDTFIHFSGEGEAGSRIGLAFTSLHHRIRETIPKSQRQEAQLCPLCPGKSSYQKKILPDRVLSSGINDKGRGVLYWTKWN